MKRQQKRKLLLLLSFLLFPITMFYFSPAMIIFAASKGIIAGSFIVFTLMLIAALFIGRLFCGWLCPAGGLQEMCLPVQAKPVAGGRYNLIKYLIWVPWLGAIISAIVAAGGLRTVDLLWGTKYGISIAEPSAYIIFYFFIALIVALAIFSGRRGFCHYVCWMAPFMIIGSKLGNCLGTKMIRLKGDADSCVKCGACSRACVMSLPVQEMVQQGSMENSECVLCGACVDSCPKKAISFGGC